MSFFKSLFSEKKDEIKEKLNIQKQSIQVEESTQNEETKVIKDLVLLSLAENYKVGETKYPDYFISRFGIGFPNERLQELKDKGYIRPATATESLTHLKVTELKSIASQFGLKVSGKKDELCNRIIDNVPESYLSGMVPDRYWMKTGSGKDLLEENSYIGFFMEKHAYSLDAIGLDINTYAKLFYGRPNGRTRDILWGEFNRRSGDYYKKGIKKGEFRDYCELLRTMALFLEEENRHNAALAMYMRYIYYRANFDAALSAMRYYSAVKKVDDAANVLFMDTEIYPFIANEILTISNTCGFSSNQLQNYMKDAFSQEQDTGAFSPEELVNLVMCGLNGDQEGQKKICNSVMKLAIKRMRR